MDDPAAQLHAQIPRLRRYARALTGDAGRADDLVQDCLERALSRLGQWRPGSDLRAWLFTIMHNLHVNALRRHFNGPTFTALHDDDAHVAPFAADGPLQLRDLEAALRALPEEQRAVLLLVAVEDVSYEQVGVILDIPIGTVMSRLHRARERLRAHMTGQQVPKLRVIS
jgi:RNA polymerase sigma-70 factor (ECF subfamily)